MRQAKNELNTVSKTHIVYLQLTNGGTGTFSFINLCIDINQKLFIIQT